MTTPSASSAALSPPAAVWTAMTWARLAVIAALFGAFYAPTIERELVARWISDGNWSHGWLIPPFSLYLLYCRRDELKKAVASPGWMGAALVIASLALYFYSSWIVPRAYPRAVSTIGTILGLTWLLGGRSILRVAWFPILFLLLAIPLPDRIYVQLTMPLRAFASWAAAAIMPWFASGLFAEAQSVVIDYVMPGSPPAQLNVEEACSGMRLMMAFVTLGVAMAYLGDRPAWQRLIMVASCVPIAVICNTIRVVTTGLLIIHGLPEYARGTPHEMLGIAILGLALGMYWLLGFIMNNLFEPIPQEDSLPPDEPIAESSVARSGRTNS